MSSLPAVYRPKDDAWSTTAGTPHARANYDDVTTLSYWGSFVVVVVVIFVVIVVVGVGVNIVVVVVALLVFIGQIVFGYAP